MATHDDTMRASRSPVLVVVLVIALLIVASLALGALTSWAQGKLPDALASFANSPSGWTFLTAVMVAAVRPSLRLGAALGVVSFVSLVLGYTFASQLRGLAYDPVPWSAVGVVAGPFVGAAAAALRGRDVRAGIGAGTLAGVLVADAGYGLTVVADSTSPVYWTLCLVGAAVLAVVTAVRVAGPGRAALVAATLAAAGVLTAGYSTLNSIL